MSKPPRVLTADEIEQAGKLTGLGMTTVDIANYFGFSKRTFDNIMERQPEFKCAVEKGRVAANATVAGSLFKNATKHNNVAAQIFWMKTRAGWREKDRRDDENGETPSIRIGYQQRSRKVDDDERRDDGPSDEPAVRRRAVAKEDEEDDDAG